ncbi:MAG: carboxypeptidase-like regulatory domain-containing protein [Leadbetterella sp.]|nr:carboxypeptidase-like regulatory domain-containing protein [Leadbetterella sp.]
MRPLYTFLFLVLPVCFSVAQTATLRGRVISEDKAPVSFVTVQLAKTTLATMTNEAGEYELRNVPYGQHTLQVSSLEIHRQESKITVNRAEHTHHFSVKLRNETELSEVQVVGKTEKKRSKPRDLP